MLLLLGTTPLNSIVTGGVLSSPSASYEKQIMLASPESRSIMASTAQRKHLVRSEFMVVTIVGAEHCGDESFCSRDIKAVLTAN
jgi:hypothetical protein